ncbi:unnamed protein product [Ostreobium quekettii]|uniref:Uncharacterized protein n=1 Tax=Ostreobium quekettii TaxID=121088 RepID=A0A8S1J6B4_9CHLO|nr:unnamed protein product [Ostreobium quekettii]
MPMRQCDFGPEKAVRPCTVDDFRFYRTIAILAIVAVFLATGADARRRSDDSDGDCGSLHEKCCRWRTCDDGLVCKGTYGNRKCVQNSDKQSEDSEDSKSKKSNDCPSGQYRNRRWRCQDCDANCDSAPGSCVDLQGCKACKPGYKLDAWRRCAQDCQNGLDPVTGQCVPDGQCPSGKYKHGTKDSWSCEKCDRNCAPGKCLDFKNCVKCEDGYGAKVEGDCRMVCSRDGSEEIVDGVCACKAGFFRNDEGNCECPANHVKIQGECTSCGEGMIVKRNRFA